MTIGNYLDIHPQSPLSSSDTLESIKSSQGIKISSSTDSLLKIIEVQGELIKKLKKQVKEWEDWIFGEAQAFPSVILLLLYL